MTRELIAFLGTADPEFKAQCSSSMVTCAERFAPSKRCHADTLFDVLRYVKDNCLSVLCTLN